MSETSEPTVMKAHRPGEFLAMVPKLLGYNPIHSLVVVGFSQKRTTIAYRLNLDALGHYQPEDLISHLRKASLESDGAIFLIYTDDELPDEPPLPFTDELIALAIAAHGMGYTTLPAMIVGANAFGVYGDDEHAPQLHSLLDIQSEDADSLDVEVRENQNSGTELPEVTDEDLAERVHAAVHSSTPEKLLEEDDMHSVIVLSGMVKARPNAKKSSQDSALVVGAAMIEMPMFRDAALITWGWGEVAGTQAMEEGRAYQMSTNVEGVETYEILQGQWKIRPDAANLKAGIGYCKEVAAHLPIEHRAPALFMAGWMEWALGRSSMAAEYLSAAIESDEEYTPARAMQILLEHGFLPEWAYIAKGGK